MDPNARGDGGYFDYDVVDPSGNKIGKVDDVWVDQATGQPEYLGIKGTGLFSSTYVVPMKALAVNSAGRTVHLPFEADVVKHAPALSSGPELTAEDEQKIDSYYGQLLASSGGAGFGPVQSGSNLAPPAYARVPTSGSLQQGAGNTTAYAAQSAGTAAQHVAQTPGNSVDYAAQGAANTAGIVENAPVRASQSASQNAEPVGGMQLRKVVRRERIYVPVDVMREHVEVVGPDGVQDVSEAQSSQPSYAHPSGAGSAAQSQNPQTNSNSASSTDGGVRRLERP